MKRFFTIIISALLANFATAQGLTITKATSRGWAGGAYGHSGCNYAIYIKYKDRVKLDSIYINNIGYNLSVSYNGVGGASLDSVHHTYIIGENESHTYTRNYNYDPDEGNHVKVKKVTPPPPPPVRHFEGKALIVYHYKGQEAFFIVKDFTVLPSVAYP